MSTTLTSRRRAVGSSSVRWAGNRTWGGIHPPARSVTSRVVALSSRKPAAHHSRGSWRATASTIRCSRCCSAALPDAAPALAPVVADSAEAPAIAVGFAPACAAAAPGAARSTEETSGPPAAGDDAGEGATGAPETGAPEIGPDGTEGTEGAATTGGRRSEPYAGSGPAGMAGLLATGAAGVDHELPVITAGPTGATPPPVGAA